MLLHARHYHLDAHIFRVCFWFRHWCCHCRLWFQYHLQHKLTSWIKIMVRLKQKVLQVQDWKNNRSILFDELFNCISPKHFIMNCNTMPLSWFWQVFIINNSLIKHAPCPNCEDCYRSSISQDLLHRRLPNFTTNNGLPREEIMIKKKVTVGFYIQNQWFEKVISTHEMVKGHVKLKMKTNILNVVLHPVTVLKKIKHLHKTRVSCKYFTIQCFNELFLQQLKGKMAMCQLITKFSYLGRLL